MRIKRPARPALSNEIVAEHHGETGLRAQVCRGHAQRRLVVPIRLRWNTMKAKGS